MIVCVCVYLTSNAFETFEVLQSTQTHSKKAMIVCVFDFECIWDLDPMEENTKMLISQQPYVRFTRIFFPWKLRSRAFISAIEHTSVFECIWVLRSTSKYPNTFEVSHDCVCVFNFECVWDLQSTSKHPNAFEDRYLFYGWDESPWSQLPGKKTRVNRTYGWWDMGIFVFSVIGWCSVPLSVKPVSK